MSRRTRERKQASSDKKSTVEGGRGRTQQMERARTSTLNVQEEKRERNPGWWMVVLRLSSKNSLFDAAVR